MTQLVDHLGADHIIVIAQLEEITTHLEGCVATGKPCYGDKSEEESKVAWAEKLATVKRDTAVLAAHGGADYDNDEVSRCAGDKAASAAPCTTLTCGM